MFKIQPNPTFTVPVKIHVPGVEGPDPLRIIYKHRQEEDLEKLAESIGKAKKITVDDLLEIVFGWEEADTEFSREALLKLKSNYPSSFAQIYEQYWESLRPARLGN